jgi:hypothetical protein
MYTLLPKLFSGRISSLQTLKKGRIISLLFTGLLLGSTLGSSAQVTSFPYQEGWEGGAFGSWTQPASNSTDWENETGTTSSTNTGPNGASEGSNYIHPDASGANPGDTIIIQNDFDLTQISGTPEIAFDYHMYFDGSTTTDGQLNVDVSTNGGTTWTNEFNRTGQQNSGSADPFNKANVNLSAYSSNTVKIRFTAIMGSQASSFDYDVSVDDVKVREQPSCRVPSNLTASNPTTTGVDLNWNASPSTVNNGYDWEIVPSGDGQGNNVVSSGNVSGTSATASGLSSGTTYDAFVRANCSGSDQSNYIGPVTFTTNCSAFTTTLTENFDGVSDPNIPTCWSTAGNEASEVETSSFSDNSAPNGVEFDDDIDLRNGDTALLVSPRLSDLPDADNRIKFQAAFEDGDAENHKLYIGVMADPTNTGTFVVLDSVTSNTDGDFAEYKVNLDNASAIGTNEYVAIAAGSVSSFDEIDFDDFVYEEIPPCPTPSNITADTDFNSVDISFDGNSQATSYVIEFGRSGFSQGNGSFISTSNTQYSSLDSLDPNTSYEFYITTVCGNDSSGTIGPVSFETDCAPFQAPLVQDFESASGTTPPTCWTNVDGESNEDWEFDDGTSRTPDDSDGDHTLGPGNGGTMAFLDGSSDADSTILESPWLDMSNFNKEAMAFWLWSETEGNNSREDFPIRIDVVTQDNINYGVESYDIENSGWERFVVDLSGFNDTVKIRFNGQDLDGSFYKDPAIDDVRFGPLDDLEPTAVVNPNENCNLTANENIAAAFENKGIDTIPGGTSLDVSYQLKTIPWLRKQ